MLTSAQVVQIEGFGRFQIYRRHVVVAGRSTALEQALKYRRQVWQLTFGALTRPRGLPGRWRFDRRHQACQVNSPRVHDEFSRRPTADEVLARLIEGNARFVRGEARFPTVQKEVLAALARGQRPSATIIGCSDSRVPPELVFDAGFGELFIIRIAGNVISPEVMGTIQYAAVHLHTPLFVVLGHEGCGAVTAAVAMKEQGARERAHISVLLDGILPGLPNPDAALTDEEQLAAAVEANVRWSMHQLLDTPEGQARMAEGIVKLVGAVYELKTGRVRFLP